MSRRRQLDLRRRSLGEIREIMSSMKSLAYIETRKLARRLDAQRAVVESIENVARDFLSFHPATRSAAFAATQVQLVIGTERGFCGDLNQRLHRHVTNGRGADASERSVLLAVGRRLHALLEEDSRVVVCIDGAGVVEEIGSVLHRVVAELGSLQERHGVLLVSSVYHGDDGIVTRELLPPFRQYDTIPQRFTHPPVLNLSPGEFLLELGEHYLFATLHEILYASLMAENRSRVNHLEGAVKHLDQRTEQLERRLNTLRQEEIIEEIEVILLSATDRIELRAASSSGE